MKTKILAIVGLVAVSFFVSSTLFAQQNAIVTASSAMTSTADLLRGKIITVDPDDEDALAVEVQHNTSTILKGLATPANSYKSTFIDIIRAVKAANAVINNSFNPDVLKIGSICLRNGVLVVTYGIGGSNMTVDVDMMTYAATFDKESQWFGDAASALRQDTAARMGIDIKEVHINEIGLSWQSLSKYIHGTDVRGCELTARVGNYTLGLTYEKSTQWGWIIYNDATSDGDHTISWATIALASFVDNNTGRDFAKEAVRQVIDLLNPEDGHTDMYVIDWNVAGGTLNLRINSGQYSVKDLALNFSVSVQVQVDLSAGQIVVDQFIVNMVTKAREMTSQNLKIAIEDVHVSGISHFEEPGVCYLVDPPYNVSIRTPKFDLTLERSFYGTIRLNSLINRETGVDLLQNAMGYLKDIVNPDNFNLDKWRAEDLDGDGKIDSISFLFEFPIGSNIAGFINISVDPRTGVATMPEDMKNAILETRQNIAGNMGVDISEVHINGVMTMMICYDRLLPTPYPRSLYQITARVDHYTLSLNYSEGSYPWDPIIYYTTLEGPDGSIDDPFIRYSFKWTTITLTSFVDNNTGRDYVAEAKRSVLDLLNPESNNTAVSYWSIVNGVLTLQIVGGDVPVTVNLSTGEVRIDQQIVDAVTKVRNEVSQKLGIVMGDVHVGSVMEYWTYPDPNSDFAKKGYYLVVSTPRFIPCFMYYTENGTIKLTGLINKETGVDLYGKAADQLKEQFDPGTFKLDDWKLDDNGLAKFKFSVDNDAKVEIKVDMASGIIKEAVYSEEYRDSEDNLVKAETTYKYEEGILREEKCYAQTLKGGRVSEECESDVKYDAFGNITQGYELTSSYGDDGKLTQKSAVIGTFQDGFFRMYAVSYDVDSAGNVTHTHVYDEAGNEISGGDGFIHPADILKTISPGTGEIRQNAEEKVVNADNNKFSEIIARMAVQDEVLKQAKDHRFVNEVAKKAGAVEQPQAHNQ